MTEQDEREAQRYCPIHGDLLEGTRSFRCSGAPEGHEFQRQGQITEAMVVAAARAISAMWVADPTRAWVDIARNALEAAEEARRG